MADLFVTGTDTGVGKTWVTLGLMAAAQVRGKTANGMKPVASGSSWRDGQLINADAEQIRARCSQRVSWQHVNPYAFAEPIAPHIAARKAQVAVDLERLAAAYERLGEGVDVVIVEGVGGWRVPLAAGIQTEDLVRRLELSVVLVVGLRLGCINHALLTAESILATGLPFAGWLANGICREYAEKQETLSFLHQCIPVPFLGDIPWMDHCDPARVARALRAARLFQETPGSRTARA